MKKLMKQTKPASTVKMYECVWWHINCYYPDGILNPVTEEAWHTITQRNS